MGALVEFWPLATGIAGALLGAGFWAAKVYAMLTSILAKLDCVERNLATHEHDHAGKVVIPAR